MKPKDSKQGANKMPISKGVAILLLVVGLLSIPVVLVGLLFGMAGSNPADSMVMTSGCILYLLGAACGVRKRQWLYLCAIGIGMFLVGNYHDKQYWQKENQEFCLQARKDPYCIEMDSGFRCAEPSPLGNLTASLRDCPALRPDQREASNSNKRKEQGRQARTEGHKIPNKIANDENISNAISKYKDIAKQIISSSDPQLLDFERDLVAIHNCLQGEYEDSGKAEIITTNELRKLIKSPKDKMNYEVYNASKGRGLNTAEIIAGLPSGDNALDCNAIAISGLGR